MMCAHVGLRPKRTEQELSSSEKVIQRPGFNTFLEKTVDAFFAAGLTGNIDEIDDLFQRNLASYQGTVVTLVNHYGQQIVGSPLPIEEQSQTTIRRFKKYIEAAKSNNFPELALLWILLSEFKSSNFQKNTTTDELIHDIQFLNGEDRANFYEYLQLYRDPTIWQQTVTEEGSRIGKVTNQLLATYPELSQGEQVLPNTEQVLPDSLLQLFGLGADNNSANEPESQ